MELIFTHCNLATMDQGRYHIIQDAGLVVSGKSITWMGPMAELDIQAHGDAKTIDCQNKWILPGFVDCHTHLIWGGSRSREFEMRLSGASYEEISRAGGGIMSTVNATRKASADQLQQAAEKRMKAMLASGVTTVEIKSGYGLNMETELKMLEVAGRLKSTMAQNVESTFLGAHALPPEFKSDSTGYVDMVINEMLPRVKDQGIATAVDVFCENIAFSREETQRIFQAATDMGFRVKLHAEQLSDSDGSALAAGFNALSCDHLEYLSEKGIQAMAQSGTIAVLLPGAFHYLRETKLPPMDALRENNVPIALSTDLNPGTSPVHAMPLILNMGCLLFGMTCEEAIAGATWNGARALGMGENKGSLEVGKDADLVLWDIEAPSDLCYLSGTTPVEMVVINGEIAYTAP